MPPGLVLRDFLDLDAALDRAHRQEGAVGPVEQERQVVLLRDVDVLGDQDRVHGVALDVHAEDLLGLGLGLVRVVGELHAARLAAAADLHLGLDHHARLAGRDELAPRSRGPPPGWWRPCPAGSDTPYSAKSSFAWYSNRSTRVRPRCGAAAGGCCGKPAHAA